MLMSSVHLLLCFIVYGHTGLSCDVHCLHLLLQEHHVIVVPASGTGRPCSGFAFVVLSY